MKNQNTYNPNGSRNTERPQILPRQCLREQLRQNANSCAERLSRSVGRMTSFDALPCPEYGAEVDQERGIIDELLYIQHCRSALERCLDSGSARLHYRWVDGRVTTTSFQRMRQGRVRVFGLQAPRA